MQQSPGAWRSAIQAVEAGTNRESNMEQFTTISLERDGALARLTLNRPSRRNGMNNLMVRETRQALAAIAGEDAVRVVLLTGAGDSFCPGADLSAMTDAGEQASDVALGIDDFQVAALLHGMPQLTVAAVNGACAGAGFGWAAACDIRVAREGAMFNTAFLNVAVAGDMGLPWSLPRLVGASKAREWSFFCEKFSADEARDAGLVARVWPAGTFHDEVEAMVRTLLARSPTALRFMKAHYLAAEQLNLGSFLELETERHLRIASGPHAAEAFRAFMEKRPPVFD
ncbi:MAG: enoyl-CoA hydratase-related protein [Pseudomonadales bacterium]